MDYLLTDTQKEILALTRQIADGEIVPVRNKLDHEDIFPRDILKTMGDAGLMGVFIPEEYGGLGGSMMDLCLVTEELSRACLGVSTSYGAIALGTLPVLISADDTMRKVVLPKVATGEWIAAFCLTESEAGSDAFGMRTRAVKDGGEYVLNGTKQWITNGGEADFYTVIAITDPSRGPRGASAFLVEADRPGLSFGKREDKMGIRASATREVIFDNLRIPESNRIGREGTGFIVTMKTLERARVAVGAQGVGLASGALDAAVSYAKERKQFGKPIASFQAVGHLLADMALRVESARALLYAVARHIDSGAAEYAMESSMVKVLGSDVAMSVAVDAVQVFGGYGYMKEYPVEKMLRDAKILQIYEGTNQIQRNEIAQALIKRSSRAGQ
ncbi:MAG: acyl-CoA dehydrogenase family protein [Thermoanaerobaculaceae bacterium]|jgi:butyryl-CoA dehydrogenase|nr:acyl-CoA dehydrogenase family protein [Thermoanaerobaculaceae bacterium]